MQKIILRWAFDEKVVERNGSHRSMEQEGEMSEYIERDAFIADKRKQYCADCDRRKGMKNGKIKFCYEIGAAPCRACGIDDMLSDVEDYPAADVRPAVRGKWIKTEIRAPFDQDEFTCSECGSWPWWCGVTDANLPNFCPNCGCSMEVDE